MRTVRIFVSSPDDARIECLRVGRVIERLNGAFRTSVFFEPVYWPEKFYSAHDDYQSQITRPADCDIVVAILRGRLGTPLSQAFHARLPPEERLPAGETYPSGTAYEILSAIKARQRGSELPFIAVFRWPEPPQISLDAPNRAEVEAQWQSLKQFVGEVFFTNEGQFKGAYHKYQSFDNFEAQVDALIRNWIKENVLGGHTVPWPIEQGSPFRGLEPFGMRHAGVFFGRTREIARSVGKLKQAAEQGMPFQLVVGPSGAGKSSFVRAGLVPKLTTPGEVEGVDTWRVALMRPGESSDGPMTILAQRLFEASCEIDLAEVGRPAALPELSKGTFATPEALARQLDHADETSVAPLLAALAEVAATERERWDAERAPSARLLLIVDQFDDLFTNFVTEELRDRFCRLLYMLARSGSVWIIVTLRAEFYGAFIKSSMEVLRTDERTVTLCPPTLTEMTEIVREPARAAGLVWETDQNTGQSLDEQLLADIDRPDLLPILQFVLERLYEKREGGENGQPLRLTFAAYNALGSFDGALNHAAQRALEVLGAAERARLPRLIRALVIPAYSVSGTTNFALQTVAFTQAAPDDETKRLARALVDARILVASLGKNNEKMINLAHQRVIEAWDEAKKIIKESLDFYRIRSDISAQLKRWEHSEKRRELLIARGLPIDEASAFALSFFDELSDNEKEFYRLSLRHAKRTKRRMRVVSAGGYILFTVAAVAIILLYKQIVISWELRDFATKNLYQFAELKRFGGNIDPDPQKSVELYRVAADNGYEPAKISLGMMLHAGDGVERDNYEAAYWFRNAAYYGSAEGLALLGMMYIKGDGVGFNISEAARLFRKSADMGNVTGEFNLGYMLVKGLGVRRDLVQGLEWFRKAAEQGSSDAQLKLAIALMRGVGGREDDAEALSLVQKAAKQGNRTAQYELGLMLEQGRGTPKNEAEALSWFLKAAEQGKVAASYRIGLIFEQGKGTLKNEAEALSWFRKASEQGSAAAAYKIGLIFEQGRGTLKNEAEALYWFQIAAGRGDAEALKHLTQIGQTVPKLFPDPNDFERTIEISQKKKNPNMNDDLTDFWSDFD